MGLLDVIRVKAATAGEMRAKLSKLQAANPHPRLGELELERRKLLGDGADDAKVVAIERQIEAALRDCERFDITCAELEQRITATQTEEDRKAFDAEVAAVEKQAAEAAKALEGYPKAASKIIEIIEQSRRAQRAVDHMNARLLAAGRTAIDSVQPRVVPTPAEQYWAAYELGVLISLPELPGFAKGWAPQAMERPTA